MDTFAAICLLLALVAFVVGAFGSIGRVSLVALGLALWVLPSVVHAFSALG